MMEKMEQKWESELERVKISSGSLNKSPEKLMSGLDAEK